MSQYDHREPTITLPGKIVAPRSKLVYLYLLTAGRSTITELKQALCEPLLALYKVLGTLVDEGLIRRHGRHYRAIEE